MENLRDTDRKNIDEFSLLLKINDKINAITEKIGTLNGQLEATLPTLITQSSTKLLIAEHKDQCRKDSKLSQLKLPSLPPQNMANKTKAGIAGGMVALAGAIYALIELLSK